jgi:hypothetical protein
MEMSDSARAVLTRTIGLPNPLEVGPTVAFALRESGGIYVDRDDVEDAEEPSQLALGDGMSSIVFSPWPLGVGAECQPHGR